MTTNDGYTNAPCRNHPTSAAVASGLCVECIERLQGENRQLRTFVRKSRTYFRAHNDDNVCATMGQKAAALLASLPANPPDGAEKE